MKKTHPPDFSQLALQSRKNASMTYLKKWARLLGVDARILRRYGCGRHSKRDSLTWPEYDGQGRVIGIMERFVNKSTGVHEKKCLFGGQRGLCLPQSSVEPEKTLFIAKGASDCWALASIYWELSSDVTVIGTPNKGGGCDHVREYINRTKPRRVIIWADRDDTDDDGSRKLANALVEDRAVAQDH